MLKEYPRPQFKRDKWLSLNGSWDFEFDDENKGFREKWYKTKQFSKTIEVPYAYQCELSGIGDATPHKYMWYKRTLDIPASWRDERIFLCFGAVDYIAKVYVNGEMVGEHIGGTTSFDIDISDYLTFNKDEISVFVEDDPTDENMPRGKQFWEPTPRVIWYTPTSGIWQSVFLACAGKQYIKNYSVAADIDRGTAKLTVDCECVSGNADVRAYVTLNGQKVACHTSSVTCGKAMFLLDVFHGKIMNTSTHSDGLCWTPENPILFDLELTLLVNGREADRVNGYFGMREVEIKDGEFYLNHHKYYMKLVLDQGYFSGGLLTPASDEELKNDIVLGKKLGFNGCRRHQKVECELFHYYADKLGYLVWGEMANCGNFEAVAAARFQTEWAESVVQRMNHPSIVAWVPINESWGAPALRNSEQQRNLLMSAYYATKMLDPSRPVISNDGWEMVKTDIIAVHNYAHGSKDDFKQHEWYKNSLSSRNKIIYEPSTNRSIFVGEYKDEGQPIILTEMGGVSYGKYDDGVAYGYSEASNESEFLAFLARVFSVVYSSGDVKGFCYTQIADVEQEINGLLTKNRKPKADIEKIARIISGEFLRQR